MKCNPYGLSVLAYANGFTLWHYLAEHATHRTNDNSYFDAVHDMLRVGDLINISGLDGAAVATVRKNSDGKVVVGFLTAFQDAA